MNDAEAVQFLHCKLFSWGKAMKCTALSPRFDLRLFLALLTCGFYELWFRCCACGSRVFDVDARMAVSLVATGPSIRPPTKLSPQILELSFPPGSSLVLKEPS